MLNLRMHQEWCMREGGTCQVLLLDSEAGGDYGESAVEVGAATWMV